MEQSQLWQDTPLLMAPGMTTSTLYVWKTKVFVQNWPQGLFLSFASFVQPQVKNGIYIYIYSIYMYVCMFVCFYRHIGGHVHVTVHVWRSENNLEASTLFYRVDLGDEIQYSGLAAIFLHLLNHLASLSDCCYETLCIQPRLSFNS